MTGYLRRQVDEIRADGALRAYGVALALVQGLIGFWWLYDGRLARVMGSGEALCWPIWQSCLGWRALVAGRADVIAAGLVAVSLGCAALFARRRTVAVGVGLLALLELAELAVLLSDFQLRANQHYMSLGVVLVYLLVPGKRDAVRALLVAFYVGAGFLKLDAEWITGAALYAPLWFFDTPPLIMAACIYVIVLELLVVWGLLARRRWVFWGAFAQVVVFHVFSWPVVQFFYPMLMFGLIAIFPLARSAPAPDPPDNSLLTRLFTGSARRSTYGVVVGFTLLQLVPIVIPGDEAITGEGRLAALHMFDARVDCKSYLLVQRRFRAAPPDDLTGGLSARIGCHPHVMLTRALRRCADGGLDAPDAPRVDWRHFAGRRTEPLREVARVDDVCRRPPTYRAFARNGWIQLDGEPWPPLRP